MSAYKIKIISPESFDDAPGSDSLRKFEADIPNPNKTEIIEPAPVGKLSQSKVVEPKPSNFT